MYDNSTMFFVQNTLNIFELEHKTKEYKKICPDGIIPSIIEYESLNDLD